MLIKGDLREDTSQPQPVDDLKEVLLEGDKVVKIERQLDLSIKEYLVELLHSYKDVFAWKPGDMPKTDPQTICHHLNINPNARLVIQPRSAMGPD